MSYFEFSTICNTEWKDCSFIVATSSLIDSVLQELAKPDVDRNLFMLGKIAYENEGYNHNCSYWFNWHFIPDQWRLAGVSTEVCNGLPYSDVNGFTILD